MSRRDASRSGVTKQSTYQGIPPSPHLIPPPVYRGTRLQEAGVRDPGHAEGRAGIHPVEDGRFEDLQAREHERPQRPRRPGRLAGDASHPIVGVELDEAVALRVRVRPDHHGRDGAPFAMALHDLHETELEQAVPVQHQERLAGKERLGPLDAASRIEDWILPRIPDTEPEARAVAQVLLDAPPQVVEVEHDLADAAGVQGLEDVLEEGPARNRDERLRRGVGERPKARPAARREHHGAVDHASSGTWAASRDRTDASSGRAASMRRPTAYTPGR